MVRKLLRPQFGIGSVLMLMTICAAGCLQLRLLSDQLWWLPPSVCCVAAAIVGLFELPNRRTLRLLSGPLLRGTIGGFAGGVLVAGLMIASLLAAWRLEDFSLTHRCALFAPCWPLWGGLIGLTIGCVVARVPAVRLRQLCQRMRQWSSPADPIPRLFQPAHSRRYIFLPKCLGATLLLLAVLGIHAVLLVPAAVTPLPSILRERSYCLVGAWQHPHQGPLPTMLGGGDSGMKTSMRIMETEHFENRIATFPDRKEPKGPRHKEPQEHAAGESGMERPKVRVLSLEQRALFPGDAVMILPMHWEHIEDEVDASQVRVWVINRTPEPVVCRTLSCGKIQQLAHYRDWDDCLHVDERVVSCPRIVSCWGGGSYSVSLHPPGEPIEIPPDGYLDMRVHLFTFARIKNIQVGVSLKRGDRWEEAFSKPFVVGETPGGVLPMPRTPANRRSSR